MATGTEGYARPEMLAESEWLAPISKTPPSGLLIPNPARSTAERISLERLAIPAVSFSRTKVPCSDLNSLRR